MILDLRDKEIKIFSFMSSSNVVYFSSGPYLPTFGQGSENVPAVSRTRGIKTVPNQDAPSTVLPRWCPCRESFLYRSVVNFWVKTVFFSWHYAERLALFSPRKQHMYSLYNI